MMNKHLAVNALALALLAAGAGLPLHAEDGSSPPAKSGAGEGGGAQKHPADVSGGRFAGDPIYVHMDPMVLPVISESGAEQLITLNISIEVKDFDTADSIHTNMPRVQDALTRALYGGLGNGTLMNGQLIDVNKVKARATAAVAQVVGANGLKEVLIEAVAQRRL